MTEPTEIPGVTPPPDADAIAAQNARDRTASDQRAADDRRAAAAPARTPEPAPVPSPAPTTPPAAAPKPDTGSTAATTPTPAPAPAPAPAAPTTTTYTIKSGDTLTSIGKRFHTTVSNLVKLNSIPNPDLIIAGRTLKVPA
jgi:LysM repeat protein